MPEHITLGDGTVIPVDYVPKGAAPSEHAMPAQPLPPPPVSIPPAVPLPAPVPQPSERELVAMVAALTAPPEVWCGYLSDRSAVVLFPGEVEALRWAVENCGKVGKLQVDGSSVWDQLDI